MRVLLAVTDSRLTYGRAEASDWQSAHAALQVVAVPAPVTTVAITRALQAGEYDGLHFIGHGLAGGVPLEDEGGALLDYATLAPLVRGRLKWLFFNVCASQAVAERIAATCAVAVLYTTTDIQDKAAYTTGSALAAALDAGFTFAEAVARTAPDALRGWKVVAAPGPQEPPSPYGASFRSGRRMAA